MEDSPPTNRFRFISKWDEINYLYDKLLYWLYQRDDKGRAQVLTERLERLLAKADRNQESILGQEYRSLVREARGDLAGAIKHRENEIRLIRRLHKISRGRPHEDVVFQT